MSFSVITFAEAPASAPQPVRFWYYPGRRDGHEFVYPMDQARRIAQLTRTRVLGTEAKISDQASADQAKVQVVEPSGATAEFKPNPASSARADSTRRLLPRVRPHRNPRPLHRLGLSLGQHKRRASRRLAERPGRFRLNHRAPVKSCQQPLASIR